MIRRLRRRHRLTWAVLFPILASLLAVALLSRPAPPLMDEAPAARESQAETATPSQSPTRAENGR